MTRLPSHLARVSYIAAAVALLAPAAGAQERLSGYRTLAPSPVFESWDLGGVLQPSAFGLESVRVDRASQWSIPIVALVPIGDRWTVDVSGAYAVGDVRLTGVDPLLDTDRYQLSGLTDMKLRATGSLVGDNVVVTFGANLPTGRTSLDETQLSALRVLAAPALAIATPALGAGAGGTAGLVLAREVRGWALAAGASYEMRGGFAPTTALVAGLPDPDFKPGGAIHLSAGAEGLIGAQGLTLNVSADVFGTDRLTLGGYGDAIESEVQLGPTFGGELQWRVGTTRLRDLTVYVADRQRTSYTRGDSTMAGSSGNYLNFGARGVIPAWRSGGVLLGVDARRHTGLTVDNTLATAAAFVGGGTIGLVLERGRYAFEPFARAQFGNIETGAERTSVRALAIGMSLAARY